MLHVSLGLVERADRLGGARPDDRRLAVSQVPEHVARRSEMFARHGDLTANQREPRAGEVDHRAEQVPVVGPARERPGGGVIEGQDPERGVEVGAGRKRAGAVEPDRAGLLDSVAEPLPRADVILLRAFQPRLIEGHEGALDVPRGRTPDVRG